MVNVRPTQWKATMQERPVFNPDADYSRDLAAGIRQARVPRKERFCLAEDADSPGGICAERAGRIMNEAIGFLYFAARAQESHGPSREVDLGWHVILSDTRVYTAVCHAVAGRFIHHNASDLLGTDAAEGEPKCDTTCGNECRPGGPGRSDPAVGYRLVLGD